VVPLSQFQLIHPCEKLELQDNDLREPEDLRVKNAVRGLLSRPSTQPLLLWLLKLCHAGLNYGGGQSVTDSGEIGALKFVSAKWRRSPFVLFDVGANDGNYLNAALDTIGNRLKAWSFEPQSASFRKLRERFGADARITLKQAAIGSEAGTMQLFFSSEGETTASLHRESISGQMQSEMVSLTTIDRICEEEQIAQIDLLKIDTEGHEMAVLLGASRTINAGSIAAIQFEFGDTFVHTPYHFADIWKLLSPRYVFYRILRHGLIEISRYAPDLEIYKTANFLCIRSDPSSER
jgi:FkbM family methyltransferase